MKASLKAAVLALSYGALCLVFGQSAMAQNAPSPYTIAKRYDVGGRETGIISPDPDGSGPLGYAAERKTYDNHGRLTLIEQGELSSWQPTSIAPASWTGFTILSAERRLYNSRGQLVKLIQEASGTIRTLTQFSYDVKGRLLCSAVRMNSAIFPTLSVDACSLGATGAAGPDRIERYTYDRYDHILKIEKAVGTPLQQDYVVYTRDPSGNPLSVKDANGNLATMEYDYYLRLKKWSFPSKTATGTVSTTDYEQYGYDANGNRTSLRKRDGSTITYQYDALNRSTVKVVPARTGLAATYTRDVFYGYDLRGLQTYARFDSSAATSDGVTTVYDGFGRITSSALKMDGVTRTLSYAWDKNGNRTELTWPDAFKNSYVYDGLDRMKTLYQGAIGSTTNMVGYTYNNRGLRATQTGRYGPVTTFGYDPIGRLNALSHDITGTAQDVAFTYSYTPASQIAQQTRNNDSYAWNGHYNVDRTYAANGLNQYTSAGGVMFTYDANGNLTSDGSTTYVYDIENRLVGASGAKSATLRYDPLGRLYETVGGGITTRLLYDGDELIAEYDTGGTLLRRYAHGRNVDDPVVMYEGAGVTAALRWLHSDHQGSIIAITGGTGAIVGLNSYDEYGIPKAGNLGRFQYTGQAWLPEIGMYYYKARAYSPTLGRFMQTDPIGYDDQLNLYAYVGADPMNRTDPSGETGETIVVTGIRQCMSKPHGCAAAAVAAAMVSLYIVSARTGDRVAHRPSVFLPPPPQKPDEIYQGAVYNKPPADAKDPNGSKAPGKPGATEGFEDPSTGEKWGKGPDGRGGWIDSKGNIWQPTGQSGGRAHGGPHWDVQGPRGESRGNIYPGGFTRPH